MARAQASRASPFGRTAPSPASWASPCPPRERPTSSVAGPYAVARPRRNRFPCSPGAAEEPSGVEPGGRLLASSSSGSVLRVADDVRHLVRGVDPGAPVSSDEPARTHPSGPSSRCASDQKDIANEPVCASLSIGPQAASQLGVSWSQSHAVTLSDSKTAKYVHGRSGPKRWQWARKLRAAGWADATCSATASSACSQASRSASLTFHWTTRRTLTSGTPAARHAAGRSRQWLGAVPAASVRAACQSLPRLGNRRRLPGT